MPYRDDPNGGCRGRAEGSTGRAPGGGKAKLETTWITCEKGDYRCLRRCYDRSVVVRISRGDVSDTQALSSDMFCSGAVLARDARHSFSPSAMAMKMFLCKLYARR